MELKDKIALFISALAFLVSLGSLIVSCFSFWEARDANKISKESNRISKDVAKRYFDQIKFMGKRDENDTLTIVQISGNEYPLKDVKLIPIYPVNEPPFQKEGKPYLLKLSGIYKGKEKGYSIPDISKQMCITQSLDNCVDLHVINIKMKYVIEEEERSFIIQ